jgi:spermidine synthase
MIVRTFIEVFPHTTLWYKYTPDFVILIGTPKPLRIDYKNFIARAQIASISEGLAADDLDGSSLLDSFMMGPETVRKYVGPGPVHTDNRPRLEFFRGADLAGTTTQNVKGMAEHRERVLPYLTNYGSTLAEMKAIREKLNTYFRATQKLILGQIAYASAQYQNAATLMNEAVELNPVDETIRYNFGVVAGLIREGEQEELQQIEQRVRQAMAQNPDDIQGHLHLATLYEMQGELGKATDELEEFLRQDPSRSEIYLLLGPLYERQDRYREALRTYERLEQQEADLPAPIFAAIAQLHLQLENLTEAEKYGKKGVAADANSWRAYLILGNVYATMNQPQKQIEYYNKALKALDQIIQVSPDPVDLQSTKQQIQNLLEQLKK